MSTRRDLLQRAAEQAGMDWLVFLYERLAQMKAILLATLREIFDENAYDRFLKRHELAESSQSYAEFLREHDIARARRPRCC